MYTHIYVCVCVCIYIYIYIYIQIRLLTTSVSTQTSTRHCPFEPRLSTSELAHRESVWLCECVRV